MNIEVEIRSFISKEKYEELLEFFTAKGELLEEELQETHYLNSEKDLRIQRNDSFAKIWLKEGNIHDEFREETEVRFNKEDFEKIRAILSNIGMETSIKWVRKRHLFDWKGIKVAIDNTRGYGRIIELEKMSTEEKKNEDLEILKETMKELEVNLTSREEFDNKLEEYKKNWRSLDI